MTIHVQCQDCFQTYQVRDDLLGKAIRCKSCGTMIRVNRGTSSDKSPKTRSQKPQPQEDLDDSDEIEPVTSSVRRRRTKTKSKTDDSMSQGIKWLLSAPWMFLIISISAGLVATAVLPETFESGNHLLILREVPIGTAYLIVGFVWYVVVGGFASSKHKEFTEQWKAMGFVERWLYMLKFRLQALVIFALIFGAVQLDNLIARALCGAAVLGVLVWKARDLKPNEWRPLCLILIGLAYIIPPLWALIRYFQH